MRIVSQATNPEDFARDHFAIATAFMERFDYKAAEGVVKAALNGLNERNFLKAHAIREEAHLLLFEINVGLGDAGAAELEISKAIQIREQIVGETSREQLQILRERKAHFLAEQGKTEEARSLLQQALAEIQQVPNKVAVLLGLAFVSSQEGDEQSQGRYTQEAYSEMHRCCAPTQLSKIARVFYTAGLKEAEKSRFKNGALLVLSSADILSKLDGNAQVLQVDALRKDVDRYQVEAAGLLEKAGYAPKAQAFRVGALHRAQVRLGDDHPHVVQLRASMALGLQRQGRFETAEALLQTNLEVAIQHRDSSGVISASIAMAGLLSERGLYHDALQYLQGAMRYDTGAVSASERCYVLAELGILFARGGLSERSVEHLERAKELARDIPGVIGEARRAKLAVLLAEIVVRDDPERAAQEIREAREIVDSLPPSQGFISHQWISSAESRIHTDAYDPAAAIASIQARLNEVRRTYGMANSLLEADLLCQRAEAEAGSGERADALVTLRDARSLLEQNHRTGSVLYGQILQRLGDMLDVEDPVEAERIREMSERVLAKIQNLTDEEPPESDEGVRGDEDNYPPM